MNNLKRKGFTLVELVIVIAVIAVLAAVLIPTFSNLIKKANTSADIQAVRQMNTHLAISEVTEEITINDVFEILREAGLKAKDYTPLAADTYFFWDEKENRILYTDKNYTVIFPEEYKEATKDNGWYSLSGTIDESSATIVLDKDNTEKQTYTVSSAADMSKLIKFVGKYRNDFNKAGNTLTINLTSDIDLLGADLSFGDLSLVNVSINGNGHVLKGLYVSENHAYSGNDSEGNKDQYGSALFTYAQNFEVKDITMKECITGSVNLKQGAVFVSQIRGKAKFENVTVEDCVVSGKNKTGILAGYTLDKITLTNVTLKNNTVISGEGESGVLFGVAIDASRNSTDHFTVSGLKMENNKIKFDENTETFTLSANDVSSYISDSALPINNEFAYKAGSKNEGRFGLAELCFVGDVINDVTDHKSQSINNIKITICAAVHSQEKLNDKTLIKKK